MKILKFIMTQEGLVNAKDLVVTGFVGSTAEKVKETTKEVVIEVLVALGELIVDLAMAIALIGGGLCILFKVAGWDDGFKWAGILFLANVLIKYLLGGI